MATLAHIPEVSQLSARVTRILGSNPGPFTLQGTNCYLLGTGKSKILVDTGVVDDDKLLRNIKQKLDEMECHIEYILITHWHHDHAGGIEGTVRLCSEDHKPKICKFPQQKKEDRSLSDGLQYSYIEDGHIFKVDGATIKALYTPGHADDHMCLLLQEEGAVFTGDTVLGEGTCVFEDLCDYMKTLQQIYSLKPTRLYPAHGSVVDDPEAHLSMYITHRQKREEQVFRALTSRERPSAVKDVVDVVYPGLADNLMKGAINNVTHCLTKLLKEKRIVSPNDGVYLVAPNST